MLFVAILLLAIVAGTVSGGTRTCQTSGGSTLVQFNKKKQDMYFPCRYQAIKEQECGPYRISVMPGNIYTFPKYQLNSIWLDVTDIASGDSWKGKTTNKKAVKFYNWPDRVKALFKKKDGSMATEGNFVFGRDEAGGVFMEDKNNVFKLTFVPWDPNNKKKYSTAEWTFECNADSSKLNEYPDQMCGGDNKNAVKNRLAKDLGMKKQANKNQDLAIYYDTFTNADIVQTNPRCREARDIMTKNCQTVEQRMQALKNCKVILHSKRHMECVTNYACDPMVVFNECIRWGCNGAGFDPKDTELCAATAEGIDFCPTFAGTGTLSARVQKAACYPDYFPLDGQPTPPKPPKAPKEPEVGDAPEPAPAPEAGPKAPPAPEAGPKAPPAPEVRPAGPDGDQKEIPGNNGIGHGVVGSRPKPMFPGIGHGVLGSRPKPMFPGIGHGVAGSGPKVMPVRPEGPDGGQKEIPGNNGIGHGVVGSRPKPMFPGIGHGVVGTVKNVMSKSNNGIGHGVVGSAPSSMSASKGIVQKVMSKSNNGIGHGVVGTVKKVMSKSNNGIGHGVMGSAPSSMSASKGIVQKVMSKSNNGIGHGVVGSVQKVMSKSNNGIGHGVSGSQKMGVSSKMAPGQVASKFSRGG